MHQLGQTRSARRADHLFKTPDTFVRAPLPGMQGATAIVHASPAIGAKFTEYTAEMDSGGRLGPTAMQRFVYVLDGVVTANGAELGPGRFAYLPSGSDKAVVAKMKSRVEVIEKPYLEVPGVDAPGLLLGDESRVTPVALNGDPWLEVRVLLPDSPAFDFAVNTMTYQPGASLSMVEVHVMEHGCLMLEGGGIYRLGDSWYAASAGDFIWMAPYCPQWFGAIGKTPAKYLIYKDWNRV